MFRELIKEIYMNFDNLCQEDSTKTFVLPATFSPYSGESTRLGKVVGLDYFKNRYPYKYSAELSCSEYIGIVEVQAKSRKTGINYFVWQCNLYPQGFITIYKPALYVKSQDILYDDFGSPLRSRFATYRDFLTLNRTLKGLARKN